MLQEVGNGVGVEHRQFPQDAERHHEDLEPIGQSIGQQALQTETSMQPERDAKPVVWLRYFLQPLLIALHALVADRVDQAVGVGRQDRHHAAGQDLLLEQLEIELLLARAERHQADLDPLLEIKRQVRRHRLHGGVARGGRIDRKTIRALVVLPDDLLQMPLDIDTRQRKDAVTQGEFEAAELVEAEKMHHQPKGRGIHEQREQHEQDGRDGNEVAGRFGELLVAGCHHGQHDRHRAAQASPDQDRLVAAVHGLDELEGLEHRQHAEDDQRPGRERADSNRHDTPDVEPADLEQHVGRDHRSQHEDEAVRPEFELRPELAQRRPLPWMQVGRPVGRHGERSDHDGDHAGNVDVAIGDDETQIGETHRDRSDGGIRIAQPRQDHHGDPRHGETQHQTADELAQEHTDRRSRVGRHGSRWI